MSYVADIPENTLTVDVDRIPDVYVPSKEVIVIRHEMGMVVMFVGNKRVELNTLMAHKIGLTMALAVSKLEPGEMIVMAINGERIELLGLVAKKVSASLLRKADDADDWQLNRKNYHDR